MPQSQSHARATLLLCVLLCACGQAMRPTASVASTQSGPAAAAPITRPARMSLRAQPLQAQSFPAGLQPLAQRFDQPTFVTNAHDGSGRLFIVEKPGTISIVSGGQILPQPFLDIRSLVGPSGPEQGLLGLAFHPQFVQNGRFFVFYTANNDANGDNTLAEFRVSANPNRADPASRRVLLAIPDFAPNHNGGMVTFGPDGYLYVGTGDGGGGGDPERNGQNINALLGKLLRLDVDDGQPYAIPRDNPFVGRTDARPEIWAYGLRNPWRFSFDRATGDLYIGDVGQNLWEEIDFQPAGSAGGANYGWSIMEGLHCYRPATGCDPSGLTPPIAEYGHDAGCAVIGGYVYRGVAYPLLDGTYLYGDYCSGRIWGLSRTSDGAWQVQLLLRANAQLSSFGEDEAGEVYVVAVDSGVIYRLTALSPATGD